MEENWKTLVPEVNSCAEFHEISNDFGNPLEIIREAISNAYDANASKIQIDISVQDIEGQKKLVIEFRDDGNGMSREVLEKNFWALGSSTSRGDNTKIGEKGHGTKIYLRSQRIYVKTNCDGHTYESECIKAFADLSKGKLHSPRTREIEYDPEFGFGTLIRIEGYNNSEEKSIYRQEYVKDYIYWFTKLGSFEREVHKSAKRDFFVELHCLDYREENYFERLNFGHYFPKENCDANKLYEKYGPDAADHFVKRYEYFNQELPNNPQIRFDALIYVEGNYVKTQYNKMIKQKADKRTGVYKVSDRYGLYLCKDFIPIQHINDWIVGFGTGSNSATLLHGFINCQELDLTANRGSIANTDPAIISELKDEVNRILGEINENLYKGNYAILQQFKTWDEEERTKKNEELDFAARKENITKRKYFVYNERSFLEPTNESELFGLLMSLNALRPDIFQFEPLDYNTTRGIDILARNISKNKISDCEFWYVELKYILSKIEFNHSFDNIRWLVCWDIGADVKNGTILSSKISDEKREMRFEERDGKKQYFLDDARGEALTRIKVLPLKYIVEKVLGCELKNA